MRSLVKTLMNALLNGRVTTHASIIQAPLSVLVTKDMLSMASHIVEILMNVASTMVVANSYV